MTSVHHRVLAALRRRADIGIDLGWSTSRDLLRIVMAMASFSMVGRRLGTADYGTYVAFYGIMTPAVALLFGGSNLAILQRLVRERDDPTEVSSGFLTLGLAFVGLGVASSIGFGVVLLDGLPIAAMVAFAIAEVIGLGFVENMASIVRGTSGFAPSVRFTLVYSVGRFVVTVALFVAGALDLVTLSIGWMLFTIVFAAYGVRVTLPRAGAPFRPVRPSLALGRTVTSFALPMFAADLKGNSDKTFLNAYGHRDDAGLYGAAYRMLQLGLFPLRAATTAMAHRLLDHDDERRGQHVKRSLKMSSLNLLLMLPITAVLFVFAPLTTIIVGDEFAESVTILRWLLLVVPLRAISNAPLMGLLGLGLVKLRATIVIGSAAVSVLLYIALIPEHSWKGAVAGTVIAEAALVLVGWVVLVIAERRHDRRDDRVPTPA